MNTKHLINKNHIKFLYMELNWNRELANAQLKKNVLNLTLPDKNSIVTHGKGSYSNNYYSNSKQTTFRYADIPQIGWYALSRILNFKGSWTNEQSI